MDAVDDDAVTAVPRGASVDPGDDRVRADALLSLELAEAPDARARAVLLGLDYDALVATAKRLAVGTAVILGVLILALAGLLAVMILLGDGEPGDGEPGDGLLADPVLDGELLLDVVALFAGAGIAFVPFIIAFLACNAVVMKLIHVPVRRQQLVSTGLFSLLWATAILTTVLVIDALPIAGPFAIMGVVITAAIITVTINSTTATLPIALARNRAMLPAVVRQYRSLPPWMTALGGRVRWMLATVVAGIVGDVLAVITVSSEPVAALPIVVVMVGAAVVSIDQGLRGRAAAWLGAQAAGVAAIAAIAVAVALVE